MDSWGVRLAARRAGIKLTVTIDDKLLCKPASLLMPELREAIKDNKDDLLYDVLLADALRYVAVECYVEGADPGSVLDDHHVAIDAAFLAGDWPAFRSAIREFARSGRREAARARGLALHASSPSPPTLVREAI